MLELSAPALLPEVRIKPPLPRSTGFLHRLRRALARPANYHLELQADAYRELLIREPELQPETIARLFW